jgi:hypothetical protein
MYILCDENNWKNVVGEVPICKNNKSSNLGT